MPRESIEESPAAPECLPCETKKRTTSLAATNLARFQKKTKKKETEATLQE